MQTLNSLNSMSDNALELRDIEVGTDLKREGLMSQQALSTNMMSEREQKHSKKISSGNLSNRIKLSRVIFGYRNSTAE